MIELETIKNALFSKLPLIKQIVFCISGAIIVIIGGYAISIINNRRKYKHIPGRKPKGINGFFFGHAPEIIKCASSHKILSEILCRDVEKHGPVVQYSFLNQTMVHTVDQDAIKHILVTENFPKHPEIYKSFGYPFGQRFIGEGLETDLNHQHWRKRRDIFNPGFYNRELIKKMPIFNSKADILISKLRSVADGKTLVNLLDQFTCIALDLIAHLGFGLEIDTVNDSENKLSAYIKTAVNQLDDCLVDPLANLKPKKTKIIKKLKYSIKILRDYAKEQLLERLEASRLSGYSQNDVLSMILKVGGNALNIVDILFEYINCIKKIEKDHIDMEVMIDDFLTFFVGGQETTANSLAFFFMEVGRHPEILEKIQMEIDNVMGERSDLKYDDINKLEYLDAVWKETLRLHPTSTYFSRISSKEMTICGYKIPSGTWLSVSPFSSHRYAKFFPEPLKFDPDRFFDEKKRKENIINSYTYYPFSVGQHNCIGKNFAIIEAKVIIVKMIKHFNVILDETQSFDAILSLTMRPKDGTRCYLKFKNE